MGYGDHKVWAPWKRWALAIAYWTVCYGLASLRGLPKKLLEQEVKTPNHFMYLVSFIGFVPVFIAAYDISAYAFNRPLRLFSTIVWPIMHILDTLRWYFSFDVGRAIVIFIGTKLFGEEPSMLLQYIGGWAGFALFMIKHRETFELWYLPEHRKFCFCLPVAKSFAARLTKNIRSRHLLTGMFFFGPPIFTKSSITNKIQTPQDTLVVTDCTL